MTDSADVKIITATDLKRQTSEALDHVLRGGAVLVTRNGRALGFFIPAKLTDEGVAVPDIAV